jgi:TonB family protein
LHFRDLTPSQRLAGALALSLLLHAAVISPLRWPFGHEPLAGQVHLSVQLRAAPPTESPASTVDRADDARIDSGKAPADDKSGRLTAPGGPPIAGGAAAGGAVAARSEAARVVDQPAPPEYPREARRRKLEGCVLASVSVSIGGDVDDVRILETDHPGVFDQSVIDSQKIARYLPAQKDGEPVASRVLTVAAFVLEPGRKMNCALKYAAAAQKVGAGATP